MECAEPGLPRGALEIDRLVRVRVDPERRLDRPAAVARPGLRRAPRLAGDDVDEAGREQHPRLVDADAAGLGCATPSLTY